MLWQRRNTQGPATRQNEARESWEALSCFGLQGNGVREWAEGGGWDWQAYGCYVRERRVGHRQREQKTPPAGLYPRHGSAERKAFAAL